MAHPLPLGYHSPDMEPADPGLHDPYPLARRRFMSMIAGGLLAAPLAAEAEPARSAEAPCAVPVLIGDGWERAHPQASGFNVRALCAALEGVTAGGANIHSVIVERHGRLVAELYWRGKDRSLWSPIAREVDFGPTVLHDMRSVSKSVVGLLVGIAREQGKIDSLATPVLDLYPQYANLRSTQRDAITLEHLLTMSSGLQWYETIETYGSLANDETRLYWDWAPYRYVLSRPVIAQPGSQFNYNGGGTAVLGDVLTRATRTQLPDLARTALFERLGISDWQWMADPYGRPLAFAGLRMRPRDLAKIGRMLLDRGQWRGQQVVPADWVTESLRPHIATGDGLQYGYQWWAGSVDWQGKQLPWCAGFGNGGQRLFIVPGLDLTVVITAGAYNQTKVGGAVNQVFEQLVAAISD